MKHFQSAQKNDTEFKGPFIAQIEQRARYFERLCADLSHVTQSLFNAGATIAAGTVYSDLQVTDLLEVRVLFGKLLREVTSPESSLQKKLISLDPK